MLQLNSKTFLVYTILIITLTIAGTLALSPTKVEYKEKVVTKTQERVRTITKIERAKDGSSVTTIQQDSESNTLTQKETESKPKSKEWLISSTIAYNVNHNSGPIYGISVSKRFILGLYGGLYANTDKDVGLAVSINF